MKQNKVHTQLYIQGIVSRDPWPNEVRDEYNKNIIRVGKSGKGDSTYVDRVKGVNSGCIRTDRYYTKRAWETNGSDISDLETLLLRHLKQPSIQTKSFHHIAGDNFYDEDNLIEELIENVILFHNINSKQKIEEIPEEVVSNSAGINSKIKQLHSNKREYKYKDKKAYKYMFDGVEYPSSSYADIFRGLAKEVYNKEDNFEQAVLHNDEFHGRIRPWFSKNEHDPRWPIKGEAKRNIQRLDGTDLWMDLNFCADDLVKRGEKLAKEFGYKDFEVITE